VLGNNDDGYINKFSCRCYFHASTIDGRDVSSIHRVASRRVASRRVASRREEGSPLHTAVGAIVLSAYYRHYTRTNNFVQTRHPLAKPLNTVVKRVTRLKIQGNVYTCLVKFVLHADKSLEGAYCRPLSPIQHKSFKRAKKKYIYTYMYNIRE